ncbi:MAG: putative CRISPR-associated protein [Actinobacteria bacterium]|nr:putative CRISPR-associated protein [Actinomycetota bacterium]
MPGRQATATTLVSTVGTSLFFPNLSSLARNEPSSALGRAFVARDRDSMVRELAKLDAEDRTCGAEINSIASLWRQGVVARDADLFFCHSATEDGRLIAHVLEGYFVRIGVPRVEAREIPGLQDEDPRIFRRQGLRLLAREMCSMLRQCGLTRCAINATGGYKAQVAIGVQVGQGLGVPVYYKHERFDDIISFPPMPVSLDPCMWLERSPMFFELSRSAEPVPGAAYLAEWDERLDALVQRFAVGGKEFLGLTATGQIFHDTFRERFRQGHSGPLPKVVPMAEKLPPQVVRSGRRGDRLDVEAFLWRVTREVPWVRRCITLDEESDVGGWTSFRLGSSRIEGVLRTGGSAVEFEVTTSATSREEMLAVVAKLNEWLDSTPRQPA